MQDAANERVKLEEDEKYPLRRSEAMKNIYTKYNELVGFASNLQCTGGSFIYIEDEDQLDYAIKQNLFNQKPVPKEKLFCNVEKMICHEMLIKIIRKAY